MLLENRISTSVRWRACAQSYSSCTLFEKYVSPATVRTCLKLYKTHIFTSFPLESLVSGSTYTVIPDSSLPLTTTHSAYAGLLLSTRSMITDQIPEHSRRMVESQLIPIFLTIFLSLST